jgi:putative Mg2+ transporter-C (MgtC) family protein
LISPEQVNFVLRLIEAAVLGGLIGLERERNNQPAGLRTHIILCLGSALIMEVSLRIGAMTPTGDPGRIAAQVVTGIGFLGAGAIMRMGASVRGLTTAASIWTTAGIGLAVGAGYHLEAISVVVIMLLSLSLLKKVGRRLSGRRRFKIIEIEVSGADEELIIQDVKKNSESGSMVIRAQITAPGDFDPPRLVEQLTRRADVVRAEVR